VIRATATPVPVPLPAFPFRWDLETEILSGRQEVEGTAGGFTGSWEIESPTGAVLTLETTGGVLGGIEVVVWPDVERAALTVPHEAPVGRVVLEAPGGEKRGVVEVEAPITGAATASETLVRLAFGTARARSVRIAANVIVDLDADGHLAGLWLEDLPLFQQGE
jgi:hypothetical protein